MNTLRPAVSHLLLQSPPRKFQPSFVEVIAKLVGSGHPDHYRGRVCHHTKAFFALAQFLLRPTSLGDIPDETGEQRRFPRHLRNPDLGRKLATIRSHGGEFNDSPDNGHFARAEKSREP